METEYFVLPTEWPEPNGRNRDVSLRYGYGSAGRACTTVIMKQACYIEGIEDARRASVEWYHNDMGAVYYVQIYATARDEFDARVGAYIERCASRPESSLFSCRYVPENNQNMRPPSFKCVWPCCYRVYATRDHNASSTSEPAYECLYDYSEGCLVQGARATFLCRIQMNPLNEMAARHCLREAYVRCQQSPGGEYEYDHHRHTHAWPEGFPASHRRAIMESWEEQARSSFPSSSWRWWGNFINNS